jgi:hypothetical protein
MPREPSLENHGAALNLYQNPGHFATNSQDHNAVTMTPSPEADAAPTPA